MNQHTTDISNILIIGCGGAGLRAAIETKLNKLKVSVIGKRKKEDAHTVLAAGGINAAFGNVDKLDDYKQHFIDTFLEGYEIGNPKLIEFLVRESPNIVKEIDEWGANLEKLDNGLLDQRFFGAHKFRRTCYSGDYTGKAILNTLLNKCKDLKIPIHDSQYVTDLLIKDNCCFGAMSFNIHNGERTVHLADATIICTGGHTRLWKKSSSRKYENNGDGLNLALNAGCKLIDMEMVQFHPTGMVLPEEIAGTLVTEAVRGEGGYLFNIKGERFMEKYDKKRMELSTRDKVAIANYTEIMEGRGTENGGIFLDISHKDRDFILNKIPNIYRQFLNSQMLDISQKPMEVAPTAHYSMGGIKVESEAHSTNINGLFAAGEAAGGVHGANRLGGNSLAEILVFGKYTAIAACEYSKSINSLLRSPKVIEKAHNRINLLLKNGENLIFPLEKELRDIMWTFCGVIRDEAKLKKGLLKLKQIKQKSKNIAVKIDHFNFQDLIDAFNLEASLNTAEATILSAIERKESRGAHQRSDFKKIDPLHKVNYTATLESGEIKICKEELIKLSEKLRKEISSQERITDIKNKLLE